MNTPLRGEVWLTDLDPVVGHEQAGRRPCLVISDDRLNSSKIELVIVLPITSKHKGVPWHVPIDPPDGGLRLRSYILCDHIRVVSRKRFLRRWGHVTPATMAAAEEGVRAVIRI